MILGLNWISDRGITYTNAFGSVSSCSPSRASLLSGIPSHQNGMYGLHNGYHHFSVFEGVRSLPNVLRENGIFTGICGKKNIGPGETFAFDFEETEETPHLSIMGPNWTVQLFAIKAVNEFSNFYSAF